MKKLLVLAISMISATTMAAEGKKNEEPKAFDGKPAIALRVIDFSGKAPRVIKGNKLSISKKQQLCWSSINVPVSGKVRVAEAFYAPAATNFSSPGMTINASADKKEFLIVGDVAATNNEYVTRCWKFDSKDPVGAYRMEVQIGDVVFKNLAFEITK